MKNRINMILFTVVVMLFLGAILTFGYTDKSYKEWYYDQFGEYPQGGIENWRYDPVYSSYLTEIGETGYNNDVDGEPETRKKEKEKKYDNRYYPEIDDAYWNGLTAKWTVDGYASKYQVTLYRNGSKVTTKTTNTKGQSFASHMVRGDSEYFFRVRAYNKDTGYWSAWQESEEKYVSNNSSTTSAKSKYPSEPEYDVGPGVVSSTKKSSNIVVPGANGGPGVSQPTGHWQSSNNKWYYINADGSYAKNAWIKYNDKWYYFDVNGIMATGWVVLEGKTYYLNPDGSMLSGTVIFDGITHYFDENGVMIY